MHMVTNYDNSKAQAWSIKEATLLHESIFQMLQQQINRPITN